MSWVEVVLTEWGAWLRTKGAGQGWGGSVDLDRLFELSRPPKAPGVHSDPVLSEVMASAFDGQARMQVVHRYVMGCAADVRNAGRLRYAGMLETTAEPGPRDHRRWIVSRGTLEGCGGAEIEMAGEVWLTETHGLPVWRVAEVMGVGPDAVYARLSRLHAQVRAELTQDARARKQRAARRQAA
jgi:hypothetical protein